MSDINGKDEPKNGEVTEEEKNEALNPEAQKLQEKCSDKVVDKASFTPKSVLMIRGFSPLVNKSSSHLTYCLKKGLRASKQFHIAYFKVKMIALKVEEPEGEKTISADENNSEKSPEIETTANEEKLVKEAGKGPKKKRVEYVLLRIRGQANVSEPAAKFLEALREKGILQPNGDDLFNFTLPYGDSSEDLTIALATAEEENDYWLSYEASKKKLHETNASNVAAGQPAKNARNLLWKKNRKHKKRRGWVQNGETPADDLTKKLAGGLHLDDKGTETSTAQNQSNGNIKKDQAE